LAIDKGLSTGLSAVFRRILDDFLDKKSPPICAYQWA
jgi:hypothetical protein